MGDIGQDAKCILTQHRLYDPSIHNITILEATGIAGGSSGKAGGLLASWATPCLAPLSFKLHTELSEKYKGGVFWGYSRVHCADLTYHLQNKTQVPESIDLPEILDWINKSGIKEFREYCSKYLTSRLLVLAQAVNITIGSADSIIYSLGSALNSLVHDHLNCFLVFSYMYPTETIGIIKSTRFISNFRLTNFEGMTQGERCNGLENKETIIDNIEIYPRPPVGFPEPETTGKVEVDQNTIVGIRNATSIISPAVENGEFVLGQACFEPQIQKHAEERVGPIVGDVPGVTGLWIATGHDQWGVQNSRGTGKIIAGMVMRDELEGVDVKALDPSNFLGE
ncbi:hypothetical protein EAF04_005329 [Stromatinia cepivora]|nr:hypothetical protein EAF04_005329 [Stromatinia cepivora]